MVQGQSSGAACTGSAIVDRARYVSWPGRRGVTGDAIGPAGAVVGAAGGAVRRLGDVRMQQVARAVARVGRGRCQGWLG